MSVNLFAHVASSGLLPSLFAFCEGRDLLALSKVSVEWYDVSLRPSLWEDLCEKLGLDWRKSLVASPNPRKYLIGQLQSQLRFGRIPGRVVLQGHKSGIVSLFVPKPKVVLSWTSGMVTFDSNICVSASTAPHFEIKLWDVESGAAIRTIKSLEPDAASPVAHARLSRWSIIKMSDEYIVYGATQKPTVSVFDLRRGEITHTLTGHVSTVTCISIQDDHCLTGSYDRTVRMFNLKTGRCVHTLLGHEDQIWCVDYRKDCPDVAVSGDAGGVVCVWNIIEGSRTCRLVSESTSCLLSIRLAEDGDTVMAGHEFGQISVWSIKSESFLMTLNAHSDMVLCLDCNPLVLVSGSRDESVVIWDRMSGQPIQTFRNHSGDIKDVRLSGTKLLSASYDRTIVVRDFASDSTSQPESIDNCLVM
eukprot:GILJ01007252.1.p1 GENE.GILJ01007252.1~~GILJ01007252.1.p1  ORF type:complete len:417 (+),score=24.85 GILJ01007252.1:66-1316(+)